MNAHAQAQDLETPAFLNTDLQHSITVAGQQSKPLLCFVTDDSATASQWEAIISKQKYRTLLEAQLITIKIRAGSQEAGYLNTVCPLDSVPAVVTVMRGSIEQKLQHPSTTTTDLETKFDALFGPRQDEDQSRLSDPDATPSLSRANDDHSTGVSEYIVLPPSDGRMRLPNNAYDALRAQTQKWLDQNIRGDNVLRLQLRLLKNVTALENAIAAIESRQSSTVPEISLEHQDRLLNTPATILGINRIATAPTPSRNDSQDAQTRSTSSTRDSSSSIPVTTTSRQQASQQPSQQTSQRATQQQRNNYVQAQREREAAERAERERIKAQIASDRAERRHQEEIRRQSERRSELDALRQANSTTSNPQSSDIRIQVRTFDGSTIKTTFARDSSIGSQVRPWIDRESKQNIPYNLKLILTPLPNRNIEASEEQQNLSELGIVGSATMVMVPVKGYVDSYAGGGTGIVSAVTGAVGGVLGGLGGLIGWSNGAVTQPPGESHNETSEARNTTEPRVRVRTLADQRMEESKNKSNELYNGNQLNFQGRKDEDSDRKED